MCRKQRSTCQLVPSCTLGSPGRGGHGPGRKCSLHAWAPSGSHTQLQKMSTENGTNLVRGAPPGLLCLVHRGPASPRAELMQHGEVRSWQSSSLEGSVRKFFWLEGARPPEPGLAGLVPQRIHHMSILTKNMGPLQAPQLVPQIQRHGAGKTHSPEVPVRKAGAGLRPTAPPQLLASLKCIQLMITGKNFEAFESTASPQDSGEIL